MEAKGNDALTEQRRYACSLDIGARSGFGTLVASIVGYAGGIVPPGIAYADRPRF